MTSAHFSAIPTLEEAARFTAQQVVELATANAQLHHQLEWFKRQIFGSKSEKRIVANPAQLTLGEMPIPESMPQAPGKPIAAHTRRPPASDFAKSAEDDGLFFDDKRVPVQTIAVPNREVEGLSPHQYEVIGEKVSHRLAQRPGSYVVLKYVRPVIKRRDSETIHCPPAPVGVIEGSRADVSFIVGLLLDKFLWHLPFYRQHLRLTDAGIRVTRQWLTQLGAKAIGLLEPIYEAQFASIRSSRVRAMDETPIKAGRAGPGKMKAGYFWPIYGELDEVCFPFFENRSHSNVDKLLGLAPGQGSVLLSDGYGAYREYAKKTGITHAECWAHCRRDFFEAQAVEPALAAEALERIGALYGVEAQIRENQLKGDAKREYRLRHARPIVEGFFAWAKEQLAEQGLRPTNPMTKALAYVNRRRAALEVFLTDPDVPVDTNHLERTLRVIPMGKNNVHRGFMRTCRRRICAQRGRTGRAVMQ